ncbi:NAD(P)/FAD-dependent oxidoreductase [Mycobacterium sp. OTB74]|uniref:NAD(P)/FAD-dependent oxidoreductase n=1 Tax=Mycobacterium sp. OTB74 TaxID=1853452 RepID=UPI00247408BD|nr:NAD(P)/FAD-dependent oxidoreductase [Mycobacterium sp. OTB74]MDH6244454.1 flavin-dependent dehydrogenase [Mycobacterium sp. OTB74]
MIDLLVAGGGPAGLATAILGARAGLEVVVVERRQGPVDKACGEGLMPHAVALLGSLGVEPPGKPFHGITYIDGRHRVTGRFRAGAGRGVRRTALHAGLLDAATAAGVRIEHGDVGPVSQDETSVHCNGFQARYLAAADGLHSPIRAALGLARPARGPRRWGIRRHHSVTPWSDCVEVYWSDDTEAYVTPVADDCVGIAILTSQKGGFDDHFSAFPALRERVHGHAHGPDRAAGPLRQRVRNRTAGRVLLVGDAAGYVDALTGEGLGIAFGASRLLVDCVAEGRPEDYDRRWRRMSRRYRLLTAAALQATATRSVRTRLVPVAARCPALFRGAVNLLAE